MGVGLAPCSPWAGVALAFDFGCLLGGMGRVLAFGPFMKFLLGLKGAHKLTHDMSIVLVLSRRMCFSPAESLATVQSFLATAP